MAGLSVVTGAFSYTGKHIAGRLLSMGVEVRTLTGHSDRPNPFEHALEVAPLNFERPERLARDLEGAETLYNTYWIRFARGDLTFERAVRNVRTLVSAAEKAGVRRIVHISITRASTKSRLAYFRGKGLAEEAVKGSAMSYAIVRPALVFGREDVLINNIAWALRRLPVFVVFGAGDYRLQPIYVDDLAAMAVSAGQERDSRTIDAVGPETYTFEELVRLIASKIGSRARIAHLNPRVALAMTRLLGYVVRDVVLTRDEVDGLMAGLLVSDGPPTGQTALSEWLAESADVLGRSYASELSRHYRQ